MRLPRLFRTVADSSSVSFILASVAVAGWMTTVAGRSPTGTVTVSRAASITATTRPLPTPTPVTRPLRSTVAMVGSSEAHPGLLFGTATRKPRLSVALAASDTWSPSETIAGTGLGRITTRWARCSTVTVTVSCTAPLCARMRVAPLSTARTRPPEVTVAIVGASLVQLTGTRPSGWPRASRPTATTVDSAVKALKASVLGEVWSRARRCAIMTLPTPVSRSTSARTITWPLRRATKRPGATNVAMVVSDDVHTGATPSRGAP